MSGIVMLQLGGGLLNLMLYIFGRNQVNLGCAVICLSFAAAFYFYPTGFLV